MSKSMPDQFADLAAVIEGEVHTDALRRYMLSTDGSIFRKMPAAVVYPRTTADVQAVVRWAGAKGLAVHPRGAGSGRMEMELFSARVWYSPPFITCR